MYVNASREDQGNKNQTIPREGTRMTEWVDSPGVFFCLIFDYFTTGTKSCVTCVIISNFYVQP